MRRIVIMMASVLVSVTSHAQSGTVNVGDAVIHYEITGSGTPLVLIHGWAQDRVE